MGVYIPPFPQAPPLPNLAPHALPVPLTAVPTAPLRPAALLVVGDPPRPASPANSTGRLRFLGAAGVWAPGWGRAARAGGLDLAVGASPSGLLSEPSNFFVLWFGSPV